jgi:hypothetical protein
VITAPVGRQNSLWKSTISFLVIALRDSFEGTGDFSGGSVDSFEKESIAAPIGVLVHSLRLAIVSLMIELMSSSLKAGFLKVDFSEFRNYPH